MEKVNVCAIECPSAVTPEVMEMDEETVCLKNKWEVRVAVLSMVFHNESLIV